MGLEQIALNTIAEVEVSVVKRQNNKYLVNGKSYRENVK